MFLRCEITSYWVANWLWDVTYFAPFVVFVMIMIVSFDVRPFLSHHAWAAVLLLFLSFGFAIPSFTYAFSFVFSSGSSAQVTIRIKRIVCLQQCIS